MLLDNRDKVTVFNHSRNKIKGIAEFGALKTLIIKQKIHGGF